MCDARLVVGHEEFRLGSYGAYGDWVVMTVFLGHDWTSNCMLNVVKTSRNTFRCSTYEGSPLTHTH